MNREQITLRLPPELLDQLREQAQERGYTVNDLILFVLWQSFRKPSVQE